MEFRSKLEEILPAKELVLPSTPGFGPYKEVMPPEAVAHPAKANTLLLKFLIENFTSVGDTVLDPMAGSGSTGVVAALLGRNAVQVELERKFYTWMEKAKENVERHITLTPRGWIKNICGDARRLSELLSQTDVVLTSPPYAESAQDSNKSPAITKPPRPQDVRQYPRKPPINKYSDNRANIGNLPLGDVDVVLTSPPYAEANRGGGIAKRGYEGKYGKDERLHLRHDRPLSDSPDNISNMPYVDTVVTSPPYTNAAAENPNVGRYRKGGKFAEEKLKGVDAVITSPPYAETYTGGGDPEKRRERLIKAGHDPKDFLGGKARNAVLKHYNEVDTVITSPPYEGSLEGTTRHTRGGIASRDPALAQTGSYATVMSFGVPVGYSPNKDNIGNLKSEDEEYEALTKGLMKNGKPTYLSEMFKVYSEMWKVLKPGGRAIIIVKPFIRNKKVVDLPYHTWLLMARVGFELEKLCKLRLKNTSFWRVLYSKKYPKVPKINHEYILVCRKPAGQKL